MRVPASVHENVVVISDTHLGRPCGAARSAAALRPLWDGADRLIINGDVAELHHSRCASRASDELSFLRARCADDGVELTLIAGNHDPLISPLRHVHLEAAGVFITHGDAVHPGVASWSPNAGRLRCALQRIWENERHGDALNHMLESARTASREVWVDQPLPAWQAAWRVMLSLPLTPWHVMRTWGREPALACDFLEQFAPSARFMLLGHTHRPSVREIAGRVIINTGSFGFPGRPRAVIIADGLLDVRDIDLVGGEYRLSRRQTARYELPHAVEPAPSALNTRPGSRRPSAAAT